MTKKKEDTYYIYAKQFNKDNEITLFPNLSLFVVNDSAPILKVKVSVVAEGTCVSTFVFKKTSNVKKKS